MSNGTLNGHANGHASEESISVEQKATDAKSAAQHVLSLLPEIYAKGFDCYTKLSNGKEIALGDSLESMHLKGTLEGIADGRLQLGDNRILGSMSLMLAQLKKQTTGTLKPDENEASETKPVFMPEETKEIHKMAEKLSEAVYYIARFGLGIDKVPLKINSPSAGFATKLATPSAKSI